MSLTACSLGNALATYGLSTTTFDDSRSRFAYFPRTRGPEKSDLLYSGRNSSLSVCLGFFIYLSLSFARLAGAYDPNGLASHGMSMIIPTKYFCHASESDRGLGSDGLQRHRSEMSQEPLYPFSNIHVVVYGFRLSPVGW